MTPRHAEDNLFLISDSSLHLIRMVIFISLAVHQQFEQPVHYDSCNTHSLLAVKSCSVVFCKYFHLTKNWRSQLRNKVDTIFMRTGFFQPLFYNQLCITHPHSYICI